MAQESLKITHRITRAYTHSIAARAAFFGWPIFILVSIGLAAAVVITAYFDVPILLFDIAFASFLTYIPLSLLAYVYMLILFSKTTGYSQGSYTFSFDKKGYSEISRTMSLQLPRDSIKKISVEKKFVTLHLGVLRYIYLPKSDKLVRYLEKNYQDKLKRKTPQ